VRHAQSLYRMAFPALSPRDPAHDSVAVARVCQRQDQMADFEREFTAQLLAFDRLSVTPAEEEEPYKFKYEARAQLVRLCCSAPCRGVPCLVVPTRRGAANAALPCRAPQCCDVNSTASVVPL
jgi:hypothetical protein